MEHKNEQNLNLLKLKRLISSGVESIPQDKKHNSAIMVIGDTGVGKTTILSFLAKRKLYIKVHGLNTILDSDEMDGLKIGHDRFSETRVPSKIIIDNMVFFDCSGFKDNRGQQFEISNSFFVQRLFDIYQDIKILLIVDESSISEARADKLPKLIRNLLNSFDSLSDIQDGVILLINRAKAEFNESTYSEEIIKMAKLKGEDGYLFKPEERQFLEYLVKNNRVSLFKQAKKEDEGKMLAVKEENLLKLIRDTNFVKSKKIKNIISESAKLSIREYVDRLAIDAEEKIRKFARDLIKQITYDSRSQYGNGLEGVMNIKKRALTFSELVQNSSVQNLSKVLSENSETEMGSLEEGVCTVVFFKGIYDKAQFYIKLLKSTISHEISKLVVGVDEEITRLQEEQNKLLKLREEVDKSKQNEEELKQKLDQSRKREQQMLWSLRQKQTKIEQKDLLLKQTVDEYQAKINKMNEEFQQRRMLCKKKEDDIVLQFQRRIQEFQNQMIQSTRKIQEVEAIKASMQEEIQAHLEDIELLNIENVSLKRELDFMAEEALKREEKAKLEQSMISKTSKTSKYPEVECPHFKNGGKCIHCIRAWKAEQKAKKKLEKELEQQ